MLMTHGVGFLWRLHALVTDGSILEVAILNSRVIE
jgi:hypothetical protein